MKKNITINFLGSGYNNKFQPYITIYDNCNNCVFKGYTYNGRVNICLDNNHYYFIKAYLNSQMINKIIYINKYSNIYTLVFDSITIRNNIITFILTDRNYLNLPIENGEVILWQRQ